MRNDELQSLVDEYLYLVEVGSGSLAADESELGHLLDRLALAVRHGVDPGEPDVLPEVPARNRDVLRKVAGSRFPGYGAYQPASSVAAEVAQERPGVANAIDDVACIADHLHAVAWLWRNRDWDTGLWVLHDSFWKEWGTAMRNLQLYVHARAEQTR